MGKYIFGVDIGGTTVKLGLFTEEGELADSWEIPTNTYNNGEAIIGDIAAAVLGKMSDVSIEESQVIGIGVGVPGPIDENGIVLGCINLGWSKKDVAKELTDLVHQIPVVIGNDANVAALGEYWKGGGQGYHNVVMVTIGTGVGGGIIINDRLISGAHGAGGEIGHIQVKEHEEETCACGKHGCIEQYGSANGIVKYAKKVLAETDKPSKLRDYEDVTSKEIFDAAKEKDELACEILDDIGELFGVALADISVVIDPDVYVIGGGVSNAGQIVLDMIQKGYEKVAFHSTKEVKFQLATLRNTAGIYGAAKLALSNL